MESLQTGDLILFGGKSIFSRLIEWATSSKYSHCGIVLRDPHFIHPSLNGLYLWESGWEGSEDAENHRLKLGVQIIPLHQVLDGYNGSVYYRPLQHLNRPLDDELLDNIHKIVHDHPYDLNPIDWVEAYIYNDPNPQKTDRMFCSAFVSLIYTKCGILSPDTDWSIVKPSDIAMDQNITFINGCTLGDLKCLKI